MYKCALEITIIIPRMKRILYLKSITAGDFLKNNTFALKCGLYSFKYLKFI